MSKQGNYLKTANGDFAEMAISCSQIENKEEIYFSEKELDQSISVIIGNQNESNNEPPEKLKFENL